MTTTENHLAGRHAAYLRQHAQDPTDWYPWGEEAFERARELDRPVFVSVGYSSCHWCHLMQRESFRDPATAAFLNDHFVAVKVDREERPDVDHLLQQYVTVAAGSGGWPLSVFLTPDRRPFYGGTYFPKHPSFAMQSFAAVLTGVERGWREDREAAEAVATESITVLADLQAPKQSPPLDQTAVRAVVTRVLALEDTEHGGLGGAPKYPDWPVMGFLLAYHRATGDAESLAAVRRWMRGIVRGGIYDQVGGGVFRYATDAAWSAPHFEKMLSDNALLLSAVADLYRIAPGEELAHVARETAAFLGRDLARPGGGYWSSRDAETRGIEGATYTWTRAELESVLTPDELGLSETLLDLNGESSPTERWVVTRPRGRDSDAAALDAVLGKLAEARGRRPQPPVIENAPADWNALAARGLMEAGAAIGDDGLVSQGRAALDWVLAQAVDAGDAAVAHLVFESRQPVSSLLLADFASTASACIAAADATGDGAYLDRARSLLEHALDLFEDGSTLFMASADAGLLVRPVAYDDIPVPSGASTLLEVHRRLRPDDRAGWERLFEPLRAFALHAPVAAGKVLALAVDAADRPVA